MTDPTDDSPNPASPLYDAMLSAIEACRDWTPDQDINDPAEALAACMRVAGNKEPERQVAGVRLRAERGYCREVKAAAGAYIQRQSNPTSPAAGGPS